MLSIKDFNSVNLDEKKTTLILGGKNVVDAWVDIVNTDTGSYSRTTTVYDDGSFTQTWDRPMDDPIAGERSV